MAGAPGRRWWLIGLVGVLTIALLAMAGYMISRPRLATTRSGDQALLDALGSPAGFNELAAVLVERGRPVRVAVIGADEHRRFETGSNGKTMTGMLLADAVERGELTLDDRLEHWLPEVTGTPIGAVTLEALASHTSGLPRDGAQSQMTWCWVIGLDCLSADEQTLLADLTAAEPGERGVVAYQPAGGYVSTASDMGRYLQSILHGTAPGMDATRPRAEALDLPPVGHVTSTGVGLFWLTGTLDGRPILFHTGETGGYRSAMMIDPERGRAAMVLSNVNRPVGAITERVLLTP